MTARAVLKMGHPILQQVAETVTEFNTPELHQLVQDMQDTMAAMHGAGLAAPQIGVSKRVVIFGVAQNPRYPDVESVPQTVLINPHIEFLSEEQQKGWEGCLSIPGMRGLVPRCTQIRYRGYDVEGNKIERVAINFHARVVQHEVDHLDGILYPYRIEDLREFGFTSVLFPELNDAGDD